MNALDILSGARNVIIDYDGVIADSEVFQLSIWRVLLTEQGLPLDRLSLHAIAGLPDRQALERICPGLPSVQYEELVLAKKQRCGEKTDDIPPVPGTWRFLQSVSGVKNLFICSGSPVATIKRFLDRNFPGIRFGSIVGKGDYDLPKPHPAPYLALLERTKIRADHAVAIEDSLPGIESAKAAGLRVIQLDRYGHPHGGTPLVPSADVLADWRRGRDDGL